MLSRSFPDFYDKQIQHRQRFVFVMSICQHKLILHQMDIRKIVIIRVLHVYFPCISLSLYNLRSYIQNESKDEVYWNCILDADDCFWR